MRAMRLHQSAAVEKRPLVLEHIEIEDPRPGELRLRVRACGVCHTDLHLVEGDINPAQYPITPGHQVVAEVEALGKGVEGWEVGDRAGLPWLYRACGRCEFCLRSEENLCPSIEFTGFDHDGGFAETVIAAAGYTLKLPGGLSDEALAPLLCAGIIGFRSLRKADLEPGERLGLVGFGASAHLAIQVARHWGCKVYVFTRSASHRRLAQDLGATWVGTAEDEAPTMLDRAIIFAPAGALVPVLLQKIRPGGTLAINAIHMSPIPEMQYERIYGERTLRSVANATYQDGVDFLRLAAEIPVRSEVKTYPLEDANQALADVKSSRIDGAGVLLP